MRKFAAIGMFDGVHLGHMYLWHQLESMARACSATTLAVSFRQHPLQLIDPTRTPALLTTADRREQLLRAAGADQVVMLDFDRQLQRMTAAEFVTYLRDNYGVTDLVMGFNNNIGSDRVSGHSGYAALSAATGVAIHIADECGKRTADGRTLSSSSVREALGRGDTAGAAAVLGRPYRLSGRVVHGEHIGTGLGYPTANIEPDDSSLLVPAPGVYAVDVLLDGHPTLRGMLNIGSRPTVTGGDNRTTIEVHILDFHGDLYGCRISVDFLRRLRDERRFDSLAQLQVQLTADARAAAEL